MSDTEISIPANLADKDLLNFFQGWKWLEDPRGNVLLDFRNATFVAPWAITLISAYALWLAEVRNRKVRATWNPFSSAGRYLLRTGFRELLGGPSEEAP